MLETRTVPAAAGRDVRVLTTPGAVTAALPGWDDLSSVTGPVGGGAWVQAWLDVHGRGHQLDVVLAGPVDRPAAALPLVRSRRAPWVWQMLGVAQLHEPTDVRGDDPEALAAITAALQERRMPLRLRRLPADSPLVPHLDALAGRRSVVQRRPALGTPAIELDERWEEPEHHFSKRRRADFRTARRRAEALGEVSLSVEEPTGQAEVESLLAELVTVEAAGWKTRAGTALAVRPQMREFFRRLCVLSAEQKALRLAFLRIDGRPVAVQLAIEQAGTYSLLKIGFDEEFARLSPGNLLMLHAVRQAAQRGLRSFEFLGAEEPWTVLWTEQVRPCLDVDVYPASPWTPLAAGEELARRAARYGLARWAARRDES